MLKDLALRVLDVYAVVDEKTRRFAEAGALACPVGCGTCCLSLQVEATLLEMLPLAFYLFATNQAELLIKRLENNGKSKQCILFREDYINGGQPGCSQYPFRALVCRLFGFSGNQDKQGNPRFALCRHMHPSDMEFQSKLPQLLPLMPVLGESGMEITALHPQLGTERKPINEALLQALNKVGMYLAYTNPESESTSICPELPPDKPISPTQSPRKRAA